jgi:predicted nuclease of predicted toxin-antitoxin system
LKLLVDENLAPSLVKRLEDLFPGSAHVSQQGMGSTPDAVIWEYAKSNEYTFVTKDRDFANLSLVWGAPPKVVLLLTGNCSTLQIERTIRLNAIRFSEFETDIGRALLVLHAPAENAR